jgi:hypothetical protein
LSFLVSTHAPAQAVSPGKQLEAQALPAQTLVPAHCVPHAPQLSGSPLVAMHCPAQNDW